MHKIDIYGNNLEQAHKKLRRFYSRETSNFSNKHRHSSQKINKKRFRARK